MTIILVSTRFRVVKQSVVNSNFGINGMTCRNPMQGTLNFAFATRHSTLAALVVCYMNLRNFSFGIFYNAFAFNDVGTFESHLLTNCHTEELLRRIFHKIVTFYVQLVAEWYFANALCFVFRIILNRHHLDLIDRIVVNNNLNRIEHSHYSRCLYIQVFAHAVLKQSHINDIIAFGNTNTRCKISYTFGSVSSTTQTTNCRHSRIVPAGNNTLFDKLQ